MILIESISESEILLSVGKVIIWGAGTNGKLLYNLCRLYNIEVVAIIDMNKEIHGKKFRKNKIIDPYKIEKGMENLPVIISVYGHENEINNQLLELNFKFIFSYSNTTMIKEEMHLKKGGKIKNKDKYFYYDQNELIGNNYKMKRFIKIMHGKILKKKVYSLYTQVRSKRYKVSIVAIFKNEGPYIKEWIEFHKLIGIDHFYLYNNNSNDDFKQILDIYIKQGLVTLIDWPFEHSQMKAYMDAIKQFSGESKWLGFIDLDEFVVPKENDNIYDFLKQFDDNWGAVLIYWKMYGSSGMIDRKEGIVIEDFIVSYDKYCDIGKIFYNTDFNFDSQSQSNKYFHHWMETRKERYVLPPINAFGEVCNGVNIAHTNNFPIQINHYFTKSLSEYMDKCKKGDVYYESNPHDLKYFYKHEKKCIGTDYSAYKYLVQLKINLKEEKNV